ncbi:MAG: lipid A deacylase LpxR family protein [Lautropia sp.]|nr:lipid A deacylase LpxR family protein [Lautropia sp.]
MRDSVRKTARLQAVPDRCPGRAGLLVLGVLLASSQAGAQSSLPSIDEGGLTPQYPAAGLKPPVHAPVFEAPGAMTTEAEWADTGLPPVEAGGVAWQWPLPGREISAGDGAAGQIRPAAPARTMKGDALSPHHVASGQREVPVIRQTASGTLGCRLASAGQTRFRIDNDLASGQDQGYTAGLTLGAYARMPADRADGSAHAGDNGWMCPLWRLLGGGELPNEHVGMRMDAAMYTPQRSNYAGFQSWDRPYAATLMFSLSGTRRQHGQLVRNEVRLGWVGPSLGGQSIQERLHRVINAPRFLGWEYQLHDEPLFELAQYRQRRWQPAGENTDLIGHWGARIGNLQSSAFAGVEWRWGPGLNENSVSAPVRPGSNEAAEVRWAGRDQVSWNIFLTAGVRAVAWDLSLDGNAFQDSHSVKRKPLVADGGAGIAMQQGPWTLQFMWVVRSREFRGQYQVPSYGSLQIGYTY